MHRTYGRHLHRGVPTCRRTYVICTVVYRLVDDVCTVVLLTNRRTDVKRCEYFLYLFKFFYYILESLPPSDPRNVNIQLTDELISIATN